MVSPNGMQEEERELHAQLQAAEASVHAALCANVDTARALGELSGLITCVNKYLARRPLPHGAPPHGADRLRPPPCWPPEGT